MAGKKIFSTLCYIEKDGRYLMLFRNKKEHDPCEGKWVGVGGKFEPGESADECLLREVREETGLRLTDYRFCGIVHFVSDTWPDEDMYLYTATGFEGKDCFGFLKAGEKVPPTIFSSTDIENRNQTGEEVPKSEADKISLTEQTDQFECSEGELFWIPKGEILSLNLWDGDRYFLKPLIEGETDIEMTCRYEGHKCVEVR